MAQPILKGARVADAVQRKGRAKCRALFKRPIERETRRRRVEVTSSGNVIGDADDFGPLRMRRVGLTDTLPDGAFSRPELLCHGLVYNGHGAAVAPVSVCEFP